MRNLFKHAFATGLLVFGAACQQEPAFERPNDTGGGEETMNERARGSSNDRNRAFTIVADPSTTITENPVTIELHSTQPGTVQVDWGDGSQASATFESAPDDVWFTVLTHTFDDDNDNSFAISIEGDIGNIYAVIDQSFDALGAKDVNLRGLKNLTNLSLPFNDIIALDLSKNHQIKYINLSFNQLLQDITLPKNHNVSGVDLTGSSTSSAEMDALISSIYTNAIRHRISDGTFWFDAGGIQPTGEMVGPPSAEAIDKLRILRDEYSWDIMPDPSL